MNFGLADNETCSVCFRDLSAGFGKTFDVGFYCAFDVSFCFGNCFAKIRYSQSRYVGDIILSFFFNNDVVTQNFCVHEQNYIMSKRVFVILGV